MFIIVAIIFTIIGYSLGVRHCTKELEKDLEEMKRELEEIETTQQY